jgi:hypothetical protein
VSGLPDDPVEFVEEMNGRGDGRRLTLASVAGDTIVADWRSDEEQGIEYWRFDSHGNVYEHNLYAQAQVEPVEGPVQRLKSAAALPLSALAYMRERRRR